jgi:site-specific DNA recombinase
VSNSFAQPVLQFTSAPPTAGTFVLYARKSTEGEDRQVQSIDDQTRHCQALATAHGLPLTFQITEARSAKRHGARPGFREMIDRIEAGEADGILAWHPDRLARNAIDGGWILDLLDRGKLRHLRFATYTFENTPEGKMMLGMIFSQAKYQVDKLAVDVRRGMNTKREQGWFPHRVGEGYKNDLESHTILVDPLRFPLLRQAVELILAGTHRPSEALRVLNEAWGYRTRPTRRGGGGPLSRSGFYHVLSNPFYYGECREKGVVYPGAHPPLMSRAEFRQIQERLATKGQAKPKVHSHAFTGLIRCGRCGSAVTASRAKGHVYYHCTDRLRVCTKSGIRAEALEGQFLTHFDKLTIPAWLEPLLVEVTCRNLAQEPVREGQAEAGQQAALAAAEKELRALTGMRLRELLTDQEFLEEKARLQKEIAGLEQQSTGKSGEATQEAKTAARVVAYAAWAREAFASAEPAEQRRLAGLLGARHLLADRVLTVEMNPYLALLTEHHEALQSLGEQPPAEGDNRIEGDSGPKGESKRKPIKPGKIGSRSRQTSSRTAVVSGGPKEGVQTEERGSGSTKKASCEETVFAGRAGEAMFKLVQDVGSKLVLLIRERGEAFTGNASEQAYRSS